MIVKPKNNRKTAWWVILFILGVTSLALLIIGWNWVLVRDHQKLKQFARHSISILEQIPTEVAILKWNIALGGVAFSAALSAMIVFFIKTLREIRLNQRQSEFLATVSHELKTPIASIELATDLLKQGGLSPKDTLQLFNTLKSETQRLKEGVSSLLEAARWENRIQEKEVEEIPLLPWLEAQLDRWRYLLGSASELRLICSAGTKESPLILKGNQKTLALILDNLLDNARKFSLGPAQVEIRVNLIQKRQGPHFEIQVKDEGVGFLPEESRLIFQRFYRAKNAKLESRNAISGTGLGLSIAWEASKSMGLRLKGSSQGYHQGALFCLEGPLSQTRSPGVSRLVGVEPL